MHEELHQFVRNDVWELVPRPKGVNVIGTKWIFKNKSDEHDTVIRNKSRLVAQVLRTKTVMKSSNVVINDEVCSEAHSENTAPVQDKPMEVDDSLPVDYVGKHSDEELMVLNDAISMPSSPEPSTPVHETQQAQHEFSPSSKQKGTSTSLVKGPSSRVRLNHLSSNILGSLNDNMRLRSKALSVIIHSCYLSQFEPKKVDEAL